MNDLKEEKISELMHKLIAQEDLTISVIKLGLETAINAGVSRCALTGIIVGLLPYRLLDGAGCDKSDGKDTRLLLENLISGSRLPEWQLAIEWSYPYENDDGKCANHSKSLLSILRHLSEVSEEGLLSIIRYLRILDDVV